MVTPYRKYELIQTITELVDTNSSAIIVGHNLHSAYLSQNDLAFARLYDLATIILADGKPIELDAKIGAARSADANKLDRLGSTDWIPNLIESIRPTKICVVGATAKANKRFCEIVLDHRPSMEILGLDGECWSSEKAQSTTEKIRTFQPRLVIIGLGMPLQERFILDNLENLPDAVYSLVGGAIDQLSGYQHLAPRWIGSLGIEWLWRLCIEPRRLAHRYLVEPWLFALSRIRHHSLSAPNPNDSNKIAVNTSRYRAER